MRFDFQTTQRIVALGVGLSTASCGSERASSAATDAGVGTPAADATMREDAESTSDAESLVDSASPQDVGQSATPDGAALGDGGRDYSTDRTAFFGDSRCADAGLQLCEDFESGMINPSIWTIAGTRPVVDTLEHARGTHALHITQRGNGLSYIFETSTFPEAKNAYFGRVFVYFKSLPAVLPDGGMSYAHWTMIAGSGTGVPGEIRVSGQLRNGENLFGVGTDNQTDAGTGDWTSSDNDPRGAARAVPLNQWLCIEWMHDGDANETQFWWDGALHPSLSTTSSLHGGNSNPYLLPQFTRVWIGWQEYQDSRELFELWIDEIAIDSKRIGCVL